MHVCAECIEDPALQDIVRNNMTESKCDYCGRENSEPFACELDIITDFMLECVEREYRDPVDELPYDSGEGGYQGETLDARDLLEEIGFSVDNEALFDDIIATFNEQDWCQRDYYWKLSPYELHKHGWERFCRTVKSNRRYTFWTAYDEDYSEYDEEHFHPAQMLPQLAEIIQKREKAVPTGTRLWRVQILNADEAPKLPERFTSPPEDKARVPNRMSPAGISMFYGADDFETACQEVVDAEDLNGKRVLGVQFEAVIALNLLDLTRLPVPTSYFSPQGSERIHKVHFLWFFCQDLSKRIRKDGREHIEYVPTQVFTEYVRHMMKTTSGEPFHGIAYPSSKTQKPCYVIFANQDECLDQVPFRRSPQLLRMVPDTLRPNSHDL